MLSPRIHVLLTSALTLAAPAWCVPAWAADFAPTILVRFSGSTAAPAGGAPFAPPLTGADGKLYGTTQRGMPNLPGGYLFQGVAYTLDPSTLAYAATALDSFGWAYGNLVQRPDGLIYGRTSSSQVGIENYASSLLGVPALLRIDAGVPTPIAPRGADQQPFYERSFQPRGQAAVDPAGVVYFAAGSTGVWRMNTDESVEQVIDFRRAEYLKVVTVGTRNTTYYTKGDGMAAAVWSAADNALYGVTSSSSGTGGDPALVPAGDTPAGTLFRVNAADIRTGGASTIEVLHTFASARDGVPYGSDTYQTGLLEDGQWLYGSSLYHGGTANQLVDGGSIWRMRKSDPSTFQILHHFRADASTDGTAQGDGSAPWGMLVRAADGNIYGTTSRDATVMNTAVAGSKAAIGAGTLFRIKVGSAPDRSDDTFEILHRFDVARDGARPVGLTAGPVANGVQKLYGATRSGGAEGNTYDGSDVIAGHGTVFSIDVPVPVAIVDSLAASAESVAVGTRVTLTWTSQNASVCAASGAWSGSKAASGSEDVAVAEGDNVYTLVCTTAEGEASAPRSVTVAGVATGGGETPDSGNGGGGGGPLSYGVLAALAFLGLVRRASSRS